MGANIGISLFHPDEVNSGAALIYPGYIIIGLAVKSSYLCGSVSKNLSDSKK